MANRFLRYGDKYDPKIRIDPVDIVMNANRLSEENERRRKLWKQNLKN
jgi:hypothetical protein